MVDGVICISMSYRLHVHDLCWQPGQIIQHLRKHNRNRRMTTHCGLIVNNFTSVLNVYRDQKQNRVAQMIL